MFSVTGITCHVRCPGYTLLDYRMKEEKQDLGKVKDKPGLVAG